MIPLLLGSTALFAGAGEHERGRIRAAVPGNRQTQESVGRDAPLGTLHRHTAATRFAVGRSAARPPMAERGGRAWCRDRTLRDQFQPAEVASGESGDRQPPRGQQRGQVAAGAPGHHECRIARANHTRRRFLDLETMQQPSATRVTRSACLSAVSKAHHEGAHSIADARAREVPVAA
jgi:hypothetical protein